MTVGMIMEMTMGEVSKSMLGMKRYFLAVIILLIPVLSYIAFTFFTLPPEKIISLTAGDFEHIQFRTKTPTDYSYHANDNGLLIKVDNSASFLMQAFTEVKQVTRVSFEWKSNGSPAIKNAVHELQRQGDDAVFKLGLLIETPDSISELFLPSWMRRVDALLKFPSDEMFFLVAGAKHAGGQRWTGPYNRRVTMISMDNVVDSQDWNQASYLFSEPVKVVAIWLMADGDDTVSSFTAHIRNIKIE